ncbi:MAG: hypothetical protein EBR82_09615 [Caulobacteraceae bacterium]|nr:hypothetical protein [Caulobacteraceae bacterium]
MAFDVDGARKAGYSDAEIAQHLASAQKFDLAGAKKAGYTDAEVIANLAPRAAGAPPSAPSVGDRIVGAGEAALNAITGATGGLLGSIGGALGGGAAALVSGDAYLASGSDPARVAEAQARMGDAVAGGAQALTYAPRTDQGQQQAQAVGEALQQLVPAAPVMQALAVPGAVRSAAPARVSARAAVEGTARDVAGIVSPAAGDTAAALASGAIDASAQAARATGQGITNAARATTTLPRRAIDAITKRGEQNAPLSGQTAGHSAGAAATDAAAQRIATAEGLGFTGDTGLTIGQATRDPAQLKFEVETAKQAEQGAPLRARAVAQNQQIYRNFENWVDQTGASAPTLRAVGQSVDRALVEQARRDKTEVNAAYRRARNSPEAQAVVDQTRTVQLGEGDNAIANTPLGFLNEQSTGLPNTGLTDAARQQALKLGIAEVQDGQLVARQATISQLEEWRKAIGQATGYEPADVRASTILKGLIDGQTEPVAGPLFRQARATRARYAQNYEDRAAISNLLSTRRGTTDRRVALEDVFDNTMLRSSLDDVRNVRRILQRGGDTGRQAWRELQGQTVRHIQEQAFGNTATDGAGNRVVSPARLDRAIQELDADGKLDFIFGRQGAQQMRDIRELAQYARTVPPEAGINHSNTAATLLAAFADAGVIGSTGLPVPVVSVARAVTRGIQDARLRRRINDALTAVERRQRGQQSERAPAPTF